MLCVQSGAAHPCAYVAKVDLKVSHDMHRMAHNKYARLQPRFRCTLRFFEGVMNIKEAAYVCVCVHRGFFLFLDRTC